MAALAAGVLLGGGAVGCSSSGDEVGDDIDPAAAVSRAAKNSEKLTSFRYRMTGKVPEQGKVDAEARMSVKPLAMSLESTTADGKGQLRLVDGALYIGGGEEATEDGKSWMKFDLSALEKEGGAGSSGGGLAGQADKNPAQESTFMTGSKDLEKVGEEKVDGVATTHYRGTVTVDELAASLKKRDKAARESGQKSLDQYEKWGVEKIAMDMWVDGEDRTKRFRMKGSTDQGPLDMTLTFDDLNRPVKVTAPPAKDTMDLAEMMKDSQAS